MQDETYFDAANISVELPSYEYHIIYDASLCFANFRISFFSFPVCYSHKMILASAEYTLNSASINELLPYLSDPDFYTLAGEALQGIFETEYAMQLAPYNSGEFSGCKRYCGAFYGVDYAQRVYDIFVPSTRTTEVFDREHYSLEGLDFSVLFEEILRDGRLISGDPASIAVEQAWEQVLNVPVLGGVISNGGIIIDAESGQTSDERSRDRAEAIEWSFSWFAEDQEYEEVDNSCGKLSIHDLRIWGSNPITQQKHYSRNDNQSSPVFAMEANLPDGNKGFREPLINVCEAVSAAKVAALGEANISEPKRSEDGTRRVSRFSCVQKAHL